jgi:hypothetical protein
LPPPVECAVQLGNEIQRIVSENLVEARVELGLDLNAGRKSQGHGTSRKID